MTNVLPDFDLGNEIIAETTSVNTKAYMEFSRDIEALYEITEDKTFYLSEEVKDYNRTAGKSVSNAWHNTVNTTRNTAGAVGNIIDAETGIFRAAWNVIIKSIELASRVIKYISDKIIDIPRNLMNLGRRILRIPQGIRAKIVGDIMLYIDADSISDFYKTGLFARIDQYITMAEEVGKGDVWGTFFKKRKGDKLFMKENDMRIARQMDKVYRQIKNIDLYQSKVNMRNSTNREIYFGSSKNIKFTDLSSHSFAGNYCEALKKLADDIKATHKKLKGVNELLGEKYDKTKMNQAFGRLHTGQQREVQNMLVNTSKVVGIVGNIVKCVMADMKTIEKAVDVIDLGKKK